MIPCLPEYFSSFLTKFVDSKKKGVQKNPVFEQLNPSRFLVNDRKFVHVPICNKITGLKHPKNSFHNMKSQGMSGPPELGWVLYFHEDSSILKYFEFHSIFIKMNKITHNIHVLLGNSNTTIQRKQVFCFTYYLVIYEKLIILQPFLKFNYKSK